MQTTFFEPSDSKAEYAHSSGTLPSGLSIIPDFLSKAEERKLEQAIYDSASPWLDDLRRRVKHFGFRYDYKARALSLSDKIGDIPDWANELGSRLVENEYFSELPDQVIINEYLPGQGIAPHIDRDTCFGPTIASISLGSATVMDFQDTRGDATGHVFLPARSAIILQGEARYHWRHGIAARKADLVEDQQYARGRRVSLTFRLVRLNEIWHSH